MDSDNFADGMGEVEEFFRWEGGLDRKEMVNF